MNLSDFVKKYSGKFVEYHSYDPAAKNQCVDLANQWLDEGLGLKAIIGTNAIDFPSKAVANGMIWIPNTPDGIPQPGDLIVYEGKIGHIDIALEGCTTSKIVAFSQNYPTGSPCVVRTGTYLRPKVEGWIHPKGTMSGLPENYGDIIHNSVQWEDVCKSLELGEAKSASSEQVINAIGGYKSAKTQAETKLAEYQAQNINLPEQISKLKDRVLELEKKLEIAIQEAKDNWKKYDDEGKAKGKIIEEMQGYKNELATLKQQAANGHFTFRLREIITLIWNGKITISKE